MSDNLDDRFRLIEGRLTVLETGKAVDEVHRNNVEKRLGGIEDTLKWLVRLIIGAVIMTGLGFAMAGGFNV